MPYYPDLSLVFIHIPKTGGTSIEKYMNKYNYPPVCKYMFNFPLINGHRQQHCTFLEMKDQIPNIENNKIFAIVRNPFHRMVSDVFFLKMFGVFDDIKDINEKIHNLLLNSAESDHDNHLLPQYKYLLEEHGYINKNIHIMRTETLTDEFRRYGFEDFNLNELKSGRPQDKYDSMLSESSKKLIKDFYRKDFELFYPELL
jgi:hypothetical protein